MTRLDTLINRDWGGYGVYRLYDQAGRLLYIGKASTGPRDRVAAHLRRRWGDTITRVMWMPCPTEASALETEARAIRNEAPRYNRQHNRGRELPDWVLPPSRRLDPVVLPVWAGYVPAVLLVAAAVVAVAVLW